MAKMRERSLKKSLRPGVADGASVLILLRLNPNLLYNAGIQNKNASISGSDLPCSINIKFFKQIYIIKRAQNCICEIQISNLPSA